MKHTRWLTAALGLVMVAAACSSPTASESGGDEGNGSGFDNDRHDEIIALMDEVAALPTFEEREALLLERAEEDGGQLSLYRSGNVDVTQPLLDAFEERYGIEASHYRAAADTIALRVLEETQAGYPGADIVQVAGRELRRLDEEAVLVKPLHEFLGENLIPEALTEYAVAPTVNVFAVVWNTDRVPNPPATWEEAMEWDGDIVVDPRDYEWFWAIMKLYLMDRQGMTEDEAVAYMTERAENWTAVPGHSLGMEMLVGGEFDLHLSQYQYQVDRYEGAPVAWEPAVEPMFVRGGGGAALVRTAPNPAAALLYLMWQGTEEAQRLNAELGWAVTSDNESIEGRLPSGYELLLTSYEAIEEEGEDYWPDLFEEVMQNAETRDEG